jgi:sugar/nucleoside kinase (ribokinase family)
VLAVVGDLLEDVVARVGGPPAVGTDTPARIERRRGGSAANVAAWAAVAGAPVRFIGCVGEDWLGERLSGELAAGGVDVRVQRRGSTGSVVVLVGPDGERTMLPDRGAATQLRDVDPAWLDDVTWLHVPSYSLLAEPIGSATLGLVDALRRQGAQLSVDVSSVAAVEAYRTDRYRSLLTGLAPDVVFANEPESRLLPDEAGIPLAVVKHGPHPVRVRGHAVENGELEVAVPPLPAVSDTTGAGDAFAAGFLAATLGGQGVEAAVTAGIDLAARALRSR